MSRFAVTASTTYAVSCEAPTYGIGDPVQYDQPRLGAWTGAALLGLPCLGITICFAIALVTGLRRGSHKKRLQTAPDGYGGNSSVSTERSTS